MLRSKIIITLLYIFKIVAGSIMAIVLFRDDFFDRMDYMFILAVFAIVVGGINTISGFITRKDNLNFGSLILLGVIYFVFGALIYILKHGEMQWLFIIITIWGSFTLFAYFRELYLLSNSMNRYLFGLLRITAVMMIIMILTMFFLPMDMVVIKFKLFAIFLVWSVILNLIMGYITVKNDYPAIRSSYNY